MDSASVFPVLRIIILLAIALWLVGRFKTPLQHLLASIIDLVDVPVHRLGEVLAHLIGWLRGAAGDAFAKIEPVKPEAWRGWPLIGTPAFALVVLASLYAEASLLALSFPLLGLDFVFTLMGGETGFLTAVVYLAQGLFWGALLLEALGLTSMTLWHRQSRPIRAVVGCVCVLALGALVETSWQIGQLRGAAMAVSPDASVALETDIFAFMNTESWDALTAPAATAAAAAPAAPDPLQEAFNELSRTLPPKVNARLLAGSALMSIIGGFSITHALAYLLALLCTLFWLALWILYLPLSIMHDMLMTARDHVMPSATELSHLGAASFLGVYDQLRGMVGSESSPPAAPLPATTTPAAAAVDDDALSAWLDGTPEAVTPSMNGHVDAQA